MRTMFGTYITFSADMPDEVIQAAVKDMVHKTKQDFLKRGKHIIIRDIRTEQADTDFIYSNCTCLARFFAIKIPRFINPLHKNKTYAKSKFRNRTAQPETIYCYS